MKKVITLIAVLHIILSGILEVNIAKTEQAFGPDSVYAKLAVVIDLDPVFDYVFVSDWNGDIWVLDGIEDWCIGDYVSMVMYDNGTEEIWDDEILSAYYERPDLVSGWIEF